MKMTYQGNKHKHKQLKKICCVYKSGPNLVTALPGCAEDKSVVAYLPDEWEPQRGGKTLENYLKEREANYENLKAEMKQEADCDNNKIDNRIRCLTEMLYEHVKQYEIDLYSTTHHIDTSEVKHEDRNKALKKIHDHLMDHRDDITRFRNEASAIERERSESLKNLLRKYYHLFIKNAARTPHQLIQDFDAYIYDINQQLLSNNRSYIELEAELMANADENYIHSKSVLNQIIIKVDLPVQGRKSRSALPRASGSFSRQRSVSVCDSRSSLLTPKNSIDDLLVDAEKFDQCVLSLLEIYRTAVMKLFTGFYSKLNVLSEDLGRECCIAPTMNIPELKELEQTIERSVRRISESLSQKSEDCSDLIKHVQNNGIDLQRSLQILGNTVRETYLILHQAVHLWDSHMIRSGLVQKLTMAGVEDLITSNDAIELAAEINFNIALEQMRQGSEIDKLQQQYDALIILLNSIGNLYTLHKDMEIQKMENYLRVIPVMSNTLLAELDLFVEKYPRIGTENKISFSTSSTPRFYGEQLHNQVPRVLFQTELQATALLNWKNGFLESLEGNKLLIPEEMQVQSRQWIDERAGILHMRYAMKMVSHSIRAERVHSAFMQRKAELEYHEKRLMDHTYALSELMVNIAEDISQNLNLNSPGLYPFTSWVDDIASRISELTAEDVVVDIEVKKLKMASYSLRLTKHRLIFEESLEPVLQQVSRDIQERIEEAHIANLRFISQICVFSEGGRYSAREAERAMTVLVCSADTLEICMTRSLEEVNMKRGLLLNEADEYIAPIRQCIEQCLPKQMKGLGKKK